MRWCDHTPVEGVDVESHCNSLWSGCGFGLLTTRR